MNTQQLEELNEKLREELADLEYEIEVLEHRLKPMSFPELTINDLVSVQPMKAPAGSAYWFRYITSQNTSGAP
jgi:hypothetical protein